MGRLFNLDNPVWSFMGKVADLILLNLVAIICSIPIFTIGASWTALYYVTVKMVKKEESYVIRDFFKSFKDNFKQATAVWLLALAAAAVFTGDFLIYRAIPDQMPKILIVIILVIAIVVLCTVIYAFPLLSRFENTVKNTIKNAFLISIINLPYTILFLILFALPFVLMLFTYRVYLAVFMIGFSGPAYLASLLWVRVFKKFEGKEDLEKQNGENTLEENTNPEVETTWMGDSKE